MTWLANPWVLWLTPLVPALAMVMLWAWRWRRRTLAEFGVGLGLVRVWRGLRLLRTVALLLGLTLVVAGAAGPQWDPDLNPDNLSRPQRDLVVVLDLSKSMLAEQPKRQDLARECLEDLAETLKKRGGYRVAFVVFAAHPKLVYPLTSDVALLAEALPRQDADSVPPELRPDPEQRETSGTRIGAALRLALLTHDPRLRGYQDIILVSDGDDPADDGEWQGPLDLARELEIPIHTVGIGSAGFDSYVPRGDSYVRDEKGRFAVTRLREAPLQSIARQTHGVYVAGHMQPVPLGRVFLDIVTTRPLREAEAGDSSLTILKQRYTWFLAAGLACLAFTLVVPDRGLRLPPRPLGFGVAAVLFAVVGISAGPAERSDELIRQGNAAFAAADYPEALRLYTLAEEETGDPGLVAFNKAACHYRLTEYLCAEQAYRCCLEDGRIPPERQARAWYDRGNSLVRQPPTAATLAEALRCYRRCLAHPAASDELRADAGHNLELARLLWQQIRPDKHDPKEPGNEPEPKPEPDKKTKPKQPPGAKSSDTNDKKNLPKQEFGKDKNGGDIKGDGPKKHVDFGQLMSLLDEEPLTPLPPDVTADLLEQAFQRMQAEQRARRRSGAELPAWVKDW